MAQRLRNRSCSDLEMLLNVLNDWLCAADFIQMELEFSRDYKARSAKKERLDPEALFETPEAVVCYIDGSRMGGRTRAGVYYFGKTAQK